MARGSRSAAGLQGSQVFYKSHLSPPPPPKSRILKSLSVIKIFAHSPVMVDLYTTCFFPPCFQSEWMGGAVENPGVCSSCLQALALCPSFPSEHLRFHQCYFHLATSCSSSLKAPILRWVNHLLEQRKGYLQSKLWGVTRSDLLPDKMNLTVIPHRRTLIALSIYIVPCEH